MTERTTVHLLRHGEVYNPDKILYGRLPDFHLSEVGRQMADLVADALQPRDIAEIWSSPLDRAQETAAPLAGRLGLTPVIDDRIIEAENVFEGQRVSVGDGVLRQPRAWKYLYNPFRPSWGEPYKDVAARMRSAVTSARRSARGYEVVLVSHQLPVWIARLDAEDRSFVHDPRKRQCNLASLTSLTFDGDQLISIVYTEPAAALYPISTKGVGA
jgi:broad specificity phosphatase PhoE